LFSLLSFDRDMTYTNRGLIQFVWIHLFHFVLVVWMFVNEFLCLWFMTIFDPMYRFFITHNIVIPFIFLYFYIRYLFHYCDEAIKNQPRPANRLEHLDVVASANDDDLDDDDDDDSFHKIFANDTTDHVDNNSNYDNHHCYNSCSSGSDCDMDNNKDRKNEVNIGQLLHTATETARNDSLKANNDTIPINMESSTSALSLPSSSISSPLQRTFSSTDTTPLLSSTMKKKDHEEQLQQTKPWWSIISWKGIDKKPFIDLYRYSSTMESNGTTQRDASEPVSLSSILSFMYHSTRSFINILLLSWQREKTLIQWNIFLFCMGTFLLSLRCMIYLYHVSV
jgi:hypothetical protein